MIVRMPRYGFRRWHLVVMAVLLAATYLFIERRYVAERRELVLQQDHIAQALTRAYLEDHGPIFTHDGALYAGRYRINWSDTLVDAVKADSGCGASIFQGDERIATTVVERGKSERAIGTRADPDIKRQVLVLGHTFRGEHAALGQRWLIEYTPLKDAEGTTVGMIATFRDLETLGHEVLFFRVLLGGTMAVLFALLVIVVRGAEAQQRSVQRSRRKMVEDRAKQQSVFFESMTQELRTPLSAVVVFAAALVDGLKEDNASRAIAGRIHAETKDVLCTVDDILDYSRIEAGNVQLAVGEVDLRAQIDVAAARATELIGARGVRLKLDVPDNLPSVNGDGVRIAQVLGYLLANAIESVDEGRVVLRARAERDAVAVEVIDAGPGLGEEELASVWDPFRSAAPGARALVGSGLGLAIVRGLVTSMGGSVTAASKLGKGSSFMVRLPRAQITV